MWQTLKNLSKDILGKKNDAAESLEEALKDRVTSPFYGYFIIAWFLVNWNYIYTAMFLNQELLYKKSGILMDDYLFRFVLPVQHSWQWFIDFIILPFFLAFFALFVMPIVTKEFYRKHLKNIAELEQIRLNQIKQKTKAETELIEAKLKQATTSKEADDINPEINWEIEFDEFSKTELYKKFYQITDSYYKYNGQIDRSDFSIDTDILVYVDSHGLISFTEDQYGNRNIEPNEKGKFYFRKFVEDPKSIKELPLLKYPDEIDASGIPF